MPITTGLSSTIAFGLQLKALSYYEEVLRLNPKTAEAYYGRASLHYKIGDLKTAFDDLTRQSGLIACVPSLATTGQW